MSYEKWIDLPKPSHKHGYTNTEIKGICRKHGIKVKDFWREFGVNTALLDEKTNEIIYYPVDVERALAFILGYRKVHPLEWD